LWSGPIEIALAAWADDLENTGEVFELTCEPGAYEELKRALDEKEIETEVAEVSMVPQNAVEIGDVDTAKKIMNLMDAFEDHDDVQNTYANFDIPQEIIGRIS